MAWEGVSIRDGSFKGTTAEFVAVLGPEVAKQVIIGFG